MKNKRYLAFHAVQNKEKGQNSDTKYVFTCKRVIKYSAQKPKQNISTHEKMLKGR